MEPQTIGKYEVLGKIGQGSMGVVFKARDPVLNRFVAIKTMSESLGADADARKRFLREAQSAARLNHPNIVTVYDLGEEQGRVYLAMELLEGHDLRDLIGAPSLEAIEEKLRIMEEVCDGLAFAHSKEVVHRDVKPANIRVLPNGSVKVTDFGLARLGTSEMTAKGTSMGTPNYMSPEQIRGEKVDARSDVFSLGTVFYELLTNHKAFDGDSLHKILAQVAEGTPAPARKWVADLPEILVRLVERSVAKDPARRFRNAGEMRIALGVVAQVLAGHLDEKEGIALLEPADAEATTILPGFSSAGVTLMQPGAKLEQAREALSRSPTLTRGPVLPRRKPRAGPAATGLPTGTGAPVKKAPSDTIPPTSGGKPSRLPLFLGLGALLLVAAGGGLWVLNSRTHTAAGRDMAKEQALMDAIAMSQLDLARESLKDKDYQQAITQAQAALKLDKENSDAKELIERAQGTLKDLDAAAEEARSKFQGGDPEGASRALAKVLAISSNHPVVAELSGQLNSFFTRQAQDARTEMVAARASAERVKATSERGFADAVEAGRAADRALAGQEYAVATKKFLEGRDGFARAQRAAEAQQLAMLRPSPPAITTTLPPVTQPSPTLPPPTTSSSTLPPPSTTMVTVPPSTTTPATTTPRAGTTASPAAVAPGGDDAAIRTVVAEYGRAIQAKDMGLFRTVKPNLSADEEKRLRNILKDYKSYKVAISVLSIRMAGTEAVVRVAREDSIDGNPFRLQQTLTMIRNGNGWIIRDIGQ